MRKSWLKFKSINIKGSFINKDLILVSLYFTFAILFLFNPSENMAVNSFKRVLGNGMMYGVDIEKRINNFYIWYLIMDPVILIAVYSGIRYLYNKANAIYSKEILSFINKFSIVAFITLLALHTGNLNYTIVNRLNLINLLSLCIIASCLIFLFFNKYLEIRFSSFKWIIFICLPLAVSTKYIFKNISHLELIAIISFVIEAGSITYLIDRLIKINKVNLKSVNEKLILANIFIYASALAYLLLLKNTALISLKRTLGSKTMQAADIITKQVFNFNLKYMSLTALILVVFIYGIIYLYRRKGIYNDEIFNFIRSAIISVASTLFAFVVLYLFYKNRSNGTKLSLLNYSTLFILCIIGFCLIFIVFRKYLSISFNIFKWIIFICLPFAVSSLFIFKNISSQKVVFVAFYFFLVSSITFLIDKLVKGNKLNEETINRLQIALAPIMYSLVFISLFLEFVNILNQYNIFITDKVICSELIIAAFIILGFIIFTFVKVKKRFHWEKVYYPGIILSLSIFMVQPYLQTAVNTELFESANHALAVSEFFKFGKIPLIETFDAHMMSNSIWGIIFGLLNHDSFGGMFITYGVYITPILCLLLYKLLKDCFDENFALFMTLLIPLSLKIVMYVDFAYITIFSLIYAIRKNNFFVYWSSLVLVCVYRLDTGFAFSIATFITYFTLVFLGKVKLNLKQFGSSLATVLISFFSVYFLICIVKGINGLLRLKEVLSLSMSNVNWAYASLGETNPLAFSFCYIILPFLVVNILLLLVYLIKTNKIEISTSIMVILFSLAFAYIANIPRSMVRHSVVEMQLQLVYFTSILFILLTATIIKTKYRAEIFLIVFFTFVIISGFLTTNTYLNTDTLINTSLNKIADENLFDENPTRKVERIIISDSMKASSNDVVQMIKGVMKGDETYLDFTNQSLLYALAEKEKPVYVNQSPGLLSGDFTQEQFINQIEKNKDKVLFALLPAEGLGLIHILDDIPNPYRYYKVSEYISRNYKPLCKSDKYVLWCRKEKYSEVYDSLKNSITNAGTSAVIRTLHGELCDYNYSDIKSLHTYNVIQIPYIWGMYDVKKAFNNPVINGAITKYDSWYSVETKNISKEKGNYIMVETDSKTPGNCSISFGSAANGTFSPLNNFIFQLNHGKKNRYLIRVSSDFYWYSGQINAFTIKSDIPLENLSIKLLQGD